MAAQALFASSQPAHTTCRVCVFAIRLIDCKSHKTASPPTTCATGALEAAGEWQRVLESLTDLRGMSLAPDPRTCASVLSSCLNAGRWPHALLIWQSFQKERLQPDLVACDSLITACASSELWDLGQFFLLESEHQRSPLQYLWALAELGISDADVIEGAYHEACSSLRSSKWVADDIVTFVWSAAMLGVYSPGMSNAIATTLGSTALGGAVAWERAS